MVESPHGGPHLFPFVAVFLGALAKSASLVADPFPFFFSTEWLSWFLTVPHFYRCPPADPSDIIKTSPASNPPFYFVCVPIKGGPPEITSGHPHPPPAHATTSLPGTACTSSPAPFPPACAPPTLSHGFTTTLAAPLLPGGPPNTSTSGYPSAHHKYDEYPSPAQVTCRLHSR